MNRTAIYARFSTDLQNERSIDDQLALCRVYAEREGLNIVATFDDRARSGGSVLGRDGLLHLMTELVSTNLMCSLGRPLIGSPATWKTLPAITSAFHFSVSRFVPSTRAW
jgi:hypothetical protein